MAKLNPYFLDLRSEYIFPLVEEKVRAFRTKHPYAKLIKLGLGDVARPLVPAVVSAICAATEEMGKEGLFRGYGPSAGYPFLREAIAAAEYSHLKISPEEIFVSDGINSDIVNVQELFAQDSTVAILDPAYPAYFDTNIMAGRTQRIIPLPCLAENQFFPIPPQEHCDFVYLCTPNNPTGMAMTKEQLKMWVDYAHTHRAVLLLDAAYNGFISSKDVPRSIYEIEGADEVAIEYKSFSKTAGFTGLRCAYMVLPKRVVAYHAGHSFSLHPLWMRRQETKFNGVAYPIQRGAEAALSLEGKTQTEAHIRAYQKTSHYLKKELLSLGHTCYGGIDCPYIWWKTPQGLTSWEMFDMLLEKCHLLCMPGKGFGTQGEGYVRLSGFTTEEIAQEAICRLHSLT